jgi:hypothetical protein
MIKSGINERHGSGGTQPLGRVDDTWHVTESLSYAKGAHQSKLGGELRTAKLFVFYDSNKRGNFTFDGTVGPWSSLPAAQASPALKALADYMASYVATASIVRGNTHHGFDEHTREGNNAPGIGSGEPRNIQLALKLIF